MLDSEAGRGQTTVVVQDSWKRCIADYHLDPGSPSAPNIATQAELKASREPLAKLIASAGDEIDRLYSIVRQQGYVVLLCNEAGVAVHHRGDESRAEKFKHWGIWLGGMWSETIEGTNGIGTCLREQQPVLVHRGQHFRARHGSLTCAGAPIFDATGKPLGVLDVSAVTQEGADRGDPLALAATAAAARALEERIFRESFRDAWIVATMPADGGSALLLALDGDQQLVGADRMARRAFSLSDETLRDGRHLSLLFDYNRALFRRGRGQDIPVRLPRTDSSEQWRALMTPPLPSSRVSHGGPEAVIHTQPRMSMLESLPMPEPSSLELGGLSPQVTRRACEYIQSHLQERIGLDALAALAGLSVHHFARAFRQSVGMPPHRYLLQQRLERAEKFLSDTQMPLSEIAAAVGFSDQSHLARHFRRRKGVSPSVARSMAREDPAGNTIQ